MNINITNIGPKEWVDLKGDISLGLLCALRSIGHDVTMSTNYFEKRALNIIVGSDFLSGMPNILQPLIRSKYDYAVFEVEAFDGSTINQRQDLPLGNYQALLLNAKYIFTPYLNNVEAFKKFGWAEKLQYVRWGYFPELRDDRMSQNSSFTHDGLFFGLAKGARAEKLNSLQASKSVRIALVGRQDPMMMRHYYITHCRWGLNLSSGEGECFTNPFRLYAMAANDMPILSDPGPDRDGYLTLCEVAAFHDFEQKLLETRPDSKGLRDRVMERPLADGWRGLL
ncbi:hypothetical protein N9Y37_01260 [Luminiphilus sp.]|nr:hypothetical protein [Luminiphilus sp.]